MGRRLWMASALAIGLWVGGWTLDAQTIAAQVPGGLAGTWTLDRDKSQFPRDIGFDADFFAAAREDGAATPGAGRSGRGGGGSGASRQPARKPQGDSFEDAQRRLHLTEEARTPPSQLTIIEAPDSVTFTDDRGASRSLHTDGRAETLSLGGVSVLVNAHREGAKLVVLYSVADLRQIRYTYARLEGTSSLSVDVEFLDRNKRGDTVRRTYNAASSAGAGRLAAGAPPPPSSAAAAPNTTVPRAGSEFAGLMRIGIVVDSSSGQATACQLKRDALEAAAAKPFTDVGLKTSLNSDEDTYLQVSVMTLSVQAGVCITRYDWSLYSMTDARLSYQRSPLLLQVVLAHQGGLKGGSPATHSADVLNELTAGLAKLAATIRDAH